MVKKSKGNILLRQKTKFAGIHLIAEFWDGKIIEDPQKIEKLLIESAKKAKNSPLEIKIHKFSPWGLTGFILLAESHIAIHTWPERNYVAIDFFSCGLKGRPYQGLEHLKRAFQPKKFKIRAIKRG